ncbi:MAG: DUF1549 domain-containing protein, partial [Candidatus Hydrogenedentes bacterium]|nr:DUF1549 domain-containing protein [Candidatus Hydrogenedentota bacterium]
MTLCLLLMVCAAHAQTLSVFPAQVQLTDAGDPQRLVLVKTRGDGVTLDVTEQATVQFAQEGIVTWEDLRLKPVADGETQVTLTCEGESLVIPVKVQNATLVPPVSFRNDVLPSLMRAGCNTGACHGSASGKNGFRLSLFGFDPPVDYLSLTRDVRSRRLNIAIPEQSLMLLKPEGAVDHEGGTRIAKGDGIYETLHRWIAEGTKNDPAELPALTEIEILPREAVLEGEGAQQRFVVMAKYSDGTDADVTRLSILSTSDDSSLTIDADGKSTAGQKGEVYVMARYGTFAVVSQAIIIPKDQALTWPDVPEYNYIDNYVFAKLKKLRVPPAELCTDQEFIRRAYLDVLGVLPTVEETRAFLEDQAGDKRAKLIDVLLQRPEFSELWAMKWAEILRVSTGANTLDVKAMHRYNDWLRQAITSNTPLDQLVRELLTAEGGNFTNPATNFYIVEADPAMMAENVAQLFAGIQIKCAQCHNHPFERWTMDDYYSFAAFFA